MSDADGLRFREMFGLNNILNLSPECFNCTYGSEVHDEKTARKSCRNPAKNKKQFVQFVNEVGWVTFVCLGWKPDKFFILDPKNDDLKDAYIAMLKKRPKDF